MSNFVWRFPKNDSNETEGPNDGGITHFTANRSANVIRESIQNSLDARADESKPVSVKIDLIALKPESFDAKGLIDALNAAVKSNHNDDAHRQQFKRGIRSLGAGNDGIDTLRITDSNTTGASDEPTPDGKPTKWEALTKGSGLSVKDQADAGGSYGLGKHAPFAVTDIRTVLYSTAWSSNNAIRRRFQGKTILVSHEDADGTRRRRTGYLGASEFTPLKDTQIPCAYQMSQTGLAVYIPGYAPEPDWQDQCIKSAVRHFFHAVITRGLEITVEGRTVASETLDEYRNLIGEQTAGFITASRTSPVAETEIEDIGRVTLRLVVEDNNTRARRQIALVRDAGMMITDRPRDMNLPRLKRLPSYWKSFSAIIECRSLGQPSVLRESESPSHTSISPQEISDPQRRKKAQKALKELGAWCKNQIEAIVAPKPAEGIENAPELAKYLAVKDEDGGPANSVAGNLKQFTVTEPVQSNRAPAGNRARRGKRAAAQTTGGPDQPNPPRQPGKGKGSKKKQSGTTARTAPVAFSSTRFRPGVRRPTHSIIATFDAIPETLRNIQLMAPVEDGPDVPVPISEAYSGSRKLSVKHNKVNSFHPGKQDRCSIEFLTQVPVSNKTYYLVYGGK